MKQLFLKELKEMYSGWSTWLVISLYMGLCIGLLWVFPGMGYQEYGYASTGPFFELASYALLFLMPAITYSLFSVEMKNGTLENLFALPVHKYEIIVSKYLVSLSVVILLIILSLPMIWVLMDLKTNPSAEGGQIAGAFIGFLLAGGFFASVGLLMSLLSDNPALCFVLALLTSFLMYEGLYFLGASTVLDENSGYFVRQFSIRYHIEYLSQGILSLRGVIYLISLQFIFLMACHWVLIKKNTR